MSLLAVMFGIEEFKPSFEDCHFLKKEMVRTPPEDVYKKWRDALKGKSLTIKELSNEMGYTSIRGTLFNMKKRGMVSALANEKPSRGSPTYYVWTGD